MNPLIMMAMAMAMSNRSNAASTAQTVLGAADGLGQTGRMAIGLVRQRNEEQARELETRETGQQLVELLREHKITTVDLTKYPALKKSIDAALPPVGVASTRSGHMHGAPAPAAAVGQGNVVSIVPSNTPAPAHGAVKRLEPHEPVDQRYVLSVVSGNVQGSMRVSAAADAAAAQAKAEAEAAIAAAAVAQATSAKAAEDAAAAAAAAKAAPADQALADKATAAKKKADEAAAAATEAEAKAHGARATAHTASHAAKELREMLSHWC
jgi:hypothetical protein